MTVKELMTYLNNANPESIVKFRVFDEDEQFDFVTLTESKSLKGDSTSQVIITN